MSKVYPSWRYHKSEPAKIIGGEHEEHADWKQSPADHEVAEAAKVPKVVKPVVPEVVPPVDPVVIPSEPPPEKEKKPKKEKAAKVPKVK